MWVCVVIRGKQLATYTHTANIEEVNENRRERGRERKIRKCRVVCGRYTNQPHTHLQTKTITEGVEMQSS